MIRTWQTGDEFLCQIDDSGQITDPLAGLHRQSPGRVGSQGLWLVNEACDLVKVRSGQQGTTIRLHMRLHRPYHEQLAERASTGAG